MINLGYFQVDSISCGLFMLIYFYYHCLLYFCGCVLISDFFFFFLEHRFPGGVTGRLLEPRPAAHGWRQGPPLSHWLVTQSYLGIWYLGNALKFSWHPSYLCRYTGWSDFILCQYFPLPPHCRKTLWCSACWYYSQLSFCGLPPSLSITPCSRLMYYTHWSTSSHTHTNPNNISYSLILRRKLQLSPKTCFSTCYCELCEV